MRFRRRPEEGNLDKELRYHFERLVRDSIAAGMEAGEARRRARLEFGTGKVAIVNQSFARRLFGGQSPLGRRVTSMKIA
jgi:hypothetical protein